MFTSTCLDLGRIYSRADLRDKFKIVDATINTGIFQPNGHKSVWLFVSEVPSQDEFAYQNMLHGDTLEWSGQMSGRKDDLIRHHERNGLELLVFYRKDKREYPGSAFRYEGRFRYKSDMGSAPTRFVLTRI